MHGAGPHAREGTRAASAMHRGRIAALGAAIATAALAVVVGWNTTRWVGTTFPGFFVMPNGVVPSIALPEWADGEAVRFFQQEVVVAGGRPVRGAGPVYAAARRHQAGTAVSYVFRRSDGTTDDAVVPSRTFSLSDYALIFGVFLFTGVAFAGTGIIVQLLTDTPASRALLMLGVAGGLYMLTAVDLYGPGWFFRLHVLVEVLLAPTGLHLALVFPRDRLGERRRPVLVAIYAAFSLFALAFEALLYDPAWYTTLHLVASAALGVGHVAIVGVLVWEFLRGDSPLLRRRVAVVALGALAALTLPGVLMGLSALLGGGLPINAGAFTAFLFPASIAYAIVQRDLFEIDRVLARALTYAIVVVVLGACYLLVLSGFGMLLPMSSRLAGPPLGVALLNLAFVFLMSPVRARVQDGVDRVFFRRGYDSEHALSTLSQALVSAHAHDDVAARTQLALDETICPTDAALLRWDDGVLAPLRGRRPLAVVQPELVTRLAAGQALARYEWDDGSDRAAPPLFAALGAELVIPVGSDGAPIAVLALGRKANGRTYGAHDVTFLRAVASQVALALNNAGAFERLAELNADLERQVEQRTASLASANADLERSIDDLRTAYEQLERSQASLVRADRLATLGRLAAGIAHEVNTPLGAVVNALALLHDLSREYADSIDVPTVTRDDHREIAREITTTTEMALGWARKVSAFVNRIRVHGRDSGPGAVASFAVRDLFAETEALLMHRARAAACRLEFTAAADLRLHGDTVRLGQVLTNLVANAIDAYEEHAIVDGVVGVSAERTGDRLVIAVRDRAGGIPAEVLPRIFDELYTTKPPGRGTGLGLWIARNLVEQSFQGKLEVRVDAGVGSCFCIDVPAVPSATDPVDAGAGMAGAAASPGTPA